MGTAAEAAQRTSESAGPVPFPRPRPAGTAVKVDPAPAPLTPTAPALTAETAARLAACRARLDPQFAHLEAEPAISGPGECGAADLVRLLSIRVPDGSTVTLDPPPKVRCAMAEALVHWVRTDIAPLASRIAPLKRLTIDTSYECRRRNHAKTGKVSQHGMGNAIDLRALTLAHDKTLTLTDPAADKDVRAALAASACARFTTVLGPGSDGAHENHIHLDIIERRGGYRICQWDVRELVGIWIETC